MEYGRTYIQVIVPLKLDWEPYYALGEGESVNVGDAVAVPFAGRRYIGVVSRADVSLPSDIKPSSIREIYGLRTEIPPLEGITIDFYRHLSQYYMCTAGEVLKAALPSSRSTVVKPRKVKACNFEPAGQDFEVSGTSAQRADAIQSAFRQGMPVLLEGTMDCDAVALVCRRVMGLEAGKGYSIIGTEAEGNGAEGRSVLWLVPDADSAKALVQRLRPVFGSRLLLNIASMGASDRNALEQGLASAQPHLTVGTRCALLRPSRNLGLIVVQDEHDASHKLSSSAPRFNARDAAVMLSALSQSKGMNVLLQSATPSFESLFNCRSKKYASVSFRDEKPGAIFEILDTHSELIKNGMCGDIPKRLLPKWNSSGQNSSYRDSSGQDILPGGVAFVRLRRAAFPKMEDLQTQFAAQGLAAAPESAQGFTLGDGVPDPGGSPAAVCVFGTDSILNRDNFRADETALQELGRLALACPDSVRKIYVLTRQPSHTVLCAIEGRRTAEFFVTSYESSVSALMSERGALLLPPFSRIVDIRLRHGFSDGLGALLVDTLSRGGWQVNRIADGCRVFLPKDRLLGERKIQLADTVTALCRENAPGEGFFFDVDPL